MGPVAERKIRGREPTTLKRLKPQDVGAVLEIARACFPRPWTLEEYLYFLESPSAVCVGAMDKENKMIGYFLALKAADELDVVSVAVVPHKRRRGVAEALITHVLYQGELNRAFLEVNVQNIPAQKLYEQMGFQVMGVRKKYYEGKFDAHVMRWEPF